jgi:response regulator RpfG family c-di-GMP phosphodiesterase
MKAVSIDDDAINLLLVEEYAREIGLEVDSYTEPVEALLRALEHPPDILFTDYMMPGMDGVEVVRRFREHNNYTPVVMITAAGDDRAIRMSALQGGCTEFLIKPLDPIEFQVRAKNLLQLKEYQNIVNNRAAHLESEVRAATEELRAANREIRSANEEVMMRERETLLLLGRASETKDPETGAHIERVSHYSRLIGKELGLANEECERLFYTAPLHDIGKVGIPDSILLKEDRLTDEELKIMQQHTTIGGDILANCKSPYLRMGCEIALTHHEKFDGSGYPYQLAGNAIPLHGRIVAVSDVFDALVSERPYKKAWDIDKAFVFLQSEAGSHFDKAIVEAFIRHRKYIYELHTTIVDSTIGGVAQSVRQRPLSGEAVRGDTLPD